MAKKISFSFYPNDWLGGTQGMTLEEKGAYLELIILQFNRGSLSEKIILRSVGPENWEFLKDKFEVNEDGTYYSERLKYEVERKAVFVQKQMENGKKGGRPPKPKINPNETQTETQTEPNEKPKGKPKKTSSSSSSSSSLSSSSSSSSSSREKKEIPPSMIELKDYFFLKVQDKTMSDLEAEKFFDHYESVGWRVGKNKMKDWEAAVRNWIKRIKGFDLQENKNYEENGNKYSDEATTSRMAKF